jgi:hypothetical protein
MASTKTETTAPKSTIDIFSLDPKDPNFKDLLLQYNKSILDSVKDWEREQTGFPPYWKPKHIGDLFFGKPILKDERDPAFPRYVVQATKFPVVCQQGPADDADMLIVRPGDYFTCSVWAALPLDDFFDIEVCAVAENSRKLPPNEASDNRPRNLWTWNVKVTKESRKLIQTRRAEAAKLLRESRETASLGEKTE